MWADSWGASGEGSETHAEEEGMVLPLRGSQRRGGLSSCLPVAINPTSFGVTQPTQQEQTPLLSSPRWPRL